MVLQNNGGDNLTVGQNGVFTFDKPIASGSNYAVTVGTQPAGQTCTVAASTGTVSGNVTNVSVACTANQYTIGGTAAGLIRPVVLQNNSGDSLTVSADGTFVFASTVTAGAAYSVTVLTQPGGQICTLSNESGTANTNVTSVSVSCSIDPNAFFVPFQAVGQYVGPPIYVGPGPPPTNGTNGLMVVASDSIAAAPIFVVKGLTKTLGVTAQFTLGPSGTISGGRPTTLVYATQGATGGDHIWAVDLSGGSTLNPTQVGNMTLTYTGSVLACSYSEAFGNLADPASALFILGFPTDPNYVCGGGSASFNYILIHLSDTTSTPPTALPALPGNLLALYGPGGALGGFVVADTAGHLLFYPGDTFKNPKIVLSNVSGFEPFQGQNVLTLVPLSSTPGSALILVTAPDLSKALYRIDYTGALSADLYDFQGSPTGGSVQDSQYFYFTDAGGSLTAPFEHILQIPLDGSAPARILYTDSETSATIPSLFLVGATGNQLVLEREPYTDVNGNSSAGEVATLATDTPSTPQVIATPTPYFGATLVGGNIYISNQTITGANLPSPPAYSTEIVALDGTMLQPLTGQSSFLYSLSSPVLQVHGVTDTGLGVGGGGVYALDPTSPVTSAPVPLMAPGGAPFVFPSMTVGASLLPVYSNIAFGSYSGSAQRVGLIYDSSQNLIVPFSVPSTDISILQPEF